jgi:pimeloyl-ACP methyl ester carboxylesterase
MHILKKEGSKPGYIVCIHGNSGSSNVFNKLFEADTLPYNLISFDLPGHGNSAKSQQYTTAFFCQEILELLSTLNGDILLVGHSLGGHFALEIAKQVKQLKGLIIFGTPPIKIPLNMEEGFLPNPHMNTLFTAAPSAYEVDQLCESLVVNTSVIPFIKEDFLRTDPNFRSAWAAHISIPNVLQNEREIFLSLTVPKFIIHGVEDSIINATYLKQLTEEASSDSEYIEINDCGHYPTLERPAIFLQHLAQISQKVFDTE